MDSAKAGIKMKQLFVILLVLFIHCQSIYCEEVKPEKMLSQKSCSLPILQITPVEGEQALLNYK